MSELINELIEKWRDVRDTAEDLATETLADEILDDLREVLRWAKRKD